MKIKRSHLTFLALIVTFSFLLFQYRVPAEPHVPGMLSRHPAVDQGFNRYTGKVVEILREGPTLIVIDGYRRTTRVRLIGASENMQSPARQRSCQKGLLRAIAGQIVEIELKEKDLNGYWRANLMKDGRDINAEDVPRFCGKETVSIPRGAG